MGLFYRIAKFIVHVISIILFPIKVVGREKIPNEGGIILCSNHISLLDPVYLSISCKRQVYYMAKEELFHNKLFGAVIRGLGAFPIKRGEKDQSGINTSIDIIKRGDVMGMFIEGTRSKDLKPQRAKAGVAMIAFATGANLVPVAIYSDRKVRPFRRVTVRIGDVIPYESLQFEKGSGSEYKRVAHMVMDEITHLWEAGHWEK